MLNTSPGRDEPNLATFPAFLLTGQTLPAGTTSMSFEDTVQNPVTGRFIRRRYTISCKGCDRLPGELDDEVLMGIIKLGYLKNDLREQTFTVTRSEIFEALEWQHRTGRYYTQISEALSLWRDIKLTYEGAWFNQVTGTHHDVEFQYLGDVITERDDDNRIVSYEITWDRVIFHLLKGSVLREIDLGLYCRLNSAAKRIYRLLNCFGSRTEPVIYDLKQFAITYIGLSKNLEHDVGRIKRALLPSFEALEREGFILPDTHANRYRKRGVGKWDVYIRIADQTRPALPAPSLKTPTLDDHPLVHELTNRGVSLIKSRALVEKHTPDYISDWIARTDLMADHEFKKDRASTLVWAIRDDPPTFGRVAKKQQSLSYHAPVPETPKDQVEDYLEGLTPQQRKDLQKHANVKHASTLEEVKKELIGSGRSEEYADELALKEVLTREVEEILRNRLT